MLPRVARSRFMDPSGKGNPRNCYGLPDAVGLPGMVGASACSSPERLGLPETASKQNLAD